MDNVLIFGRFLNLIFNMFVNFRRGLSPPGFRAAQHMKQQCIYLFFTMFSVLVIGCRNHREKLVKDFTGHDFEELALVERYEDYDEYSGSGYFASLYDIAPADADALEKIMHDRADASYFARTEFYPMLRPGTNYRYRLLSKDSEVTGVILDKDRFRIIFYHSREGR